MPASCISKSKRRSKTSLAPLVLAYLKGKMIQILIFRNHWVFSLHFSCSDTSRYKDYESLKPPNLMQQVTRNGGLVVKKFKRFTPWLKRRTGPNLNRSSFSTTD
eukprot:417705-Pelagomonas_calceolata.AAC.2